jgi:hypothetical protein
MRRTRIRSRTDDRRSPQADATKAIRQRAYEIYFNRRGLNGDALADWLQAEREFECHQQQELRAREARTRGGTELASPECEC